MCHSVGMTQVTPETQTPEPWVPDASTLGARLALIRQRMGWNITEAARECHVHAESWRLWEQQGREPRRLVTIAMAIATRTGVDLDWLVYGPNKGSRLTSSKWNGTRVLARSVQFGEQLSPFGSDTCRSVNKTKPIVNRLRGSREYVRQ